MVWLGVPGAGFDGFTRDGCGWRVPVVGGGGVNWDRRGFGCTKGRCGGVALGMGVGVVYHGWEYTSGR